MLHITLSIIATSILAILGGVIIKYALDHKSDENNVWVTSIWIGSFVIFLLAVWVR